MFGTQRGVQAGVGDELANESDPLGWQAGRVSVVVRLRTSRW